MRFLNLARAVRAFPGAPELDAADERLLGIFAAAWHEGRNIGVVEAMGMVGDLSPRTVHRRITSLRQRGFIYFDVDHAGTKKYVVPTEATREYFAHLGRCMAEAQGLPE
jgi:DNA-binding MarR family transcriptional regulator